ncbi:MAG TPA: hypothetical protein PK765_03385 [bacterium]|nr:hypothetical protein [bacterium]
MRPKTITPCESTLGTVFSTLDRIDAAMHELRSAERSDGRGREAFTYSTAFDRLHG